MRVVWEGNLSPTVVNVSGAGGESQTHGSECEWCRRGISGPT